MQKQAIISLCARVVGKTGSKTLPASTCREKIDVKSLFFFTHSSHHNAPFRRKSSNASRRRQDHPLPPTLPSFLPLPLPLPPFNVLPFSIRIEYPSTPLCSSRISRGSKSVVPVVTLPRLRCQKHRLALIRKSERKPSGLAAPSSSCDTPLPSSQP